MVLLVEPPDVGVIVTVDGAPAWVVTAAVAPVIVAVSVATTVVASPEKSLGENVVLTVPLVPVVPELEERVPPGLALPLVRVAVGYAPFPKDQVTGTPGWPDESVAVTVIAEPPAVKVWAVLGVTATVVE